MEYSISTTLYKHFSCLDQPWSLSTIINNRIRRNIAWAGTIHEFWYFMLLCWQQSRQWLWQSVATAAVSGNSSCSCDSSGITLHLLLEIFFTTATNSSLTFFNIILSNAPMWLDIFSQCSKGMLSNQNAKVGQQNHEHQLYSIVSLMFWISVAKHHSKASILHRCLQGHTNNGPSQLVKTSDFVAHLDFARLKKKTC